MPARTQAAWKPLRIREPAEVSLMFFGFVYGLPYWFTNTHPIGSRGGLPLCPIDPYLRSRSRFNSHTKIGCSGTPRASPFLVFWNDT
jgi:hypothetical protein